ncbi:armadillo segment polarity protein [Galendromus occidentalis]|uniref:Armadillo segment polarity protein n=1 Tax=Galendromus occidentalis TaxID=34638 RepID=A0AAJ6VXZ6_9ACAR|nr:armadillo segment polarity protein [Galendromus occidentalis]
MKPDYACALPGQSNISHQEQLSMWQQDSYLNDETDSGVVSGALSVATQMNDDNWDAFDWETNSNGLGSQFSGSVPMEQSMDVATQQINPPRSQRGRSTIFNQTIDEQMEISSSQFSDHDGVNLQMISDVQMLSGPASEPSLIPAARALPGLVKLLNDEDQVVVAQATATVHQLSNMDTSVDVLIQYPQMIASIVKAFMNSNDPETTRCAAGALHNFSRKREGRQGIFEADGIPALVKLLSSPLEGVVFYVITTLHNLLLYQEGSKTAVSIAGGLQKMVCLLQRNNPKFLTIVTDCLQILAYGNQAAKLTILASGGPSELLRILRSFNYEKLLWTTTRVLKVLSVCSSNKPAIIEAGGIEVLTQHLGSTSSRLVINCLFTIRNLSDAAIPQENIEGLLHQLVRLLTSSNVDIITCAAGALSNLTCNNQRNKSIVFRIGGCEALLQTVYHAGDREEITEPAICCLRHLTCRYPEAELAQQVVRKYHGIQTIAKLLHVSRWPLKKAIIGLIRNLALHQENHVLFREHNLMHMMKETLERASTEVMNGAQNSTPRPVLEGVKMVEIIDAILGAFHILAKDAANRPTIRSLHAAVLLVRLMYCEIENITRLAALVLCELSTDREGVNHLEEERLLAPLQELSRYQNQATANYAAHVIDARNRFRALESNFGQSRFGFN